jgi:hypothetical protein
MGEPLRLRICVIRRALTPAGRPRTRWRADAPERRKTAEQRPRQGGPTSPCPSRVGSFDPLGSCREQWAATYGNQAQARARSRRLDSHGAGPPVSTATPVRTSDSGYERASAAAGAGLTAALLALEWLVAGRKRSQQRVDAALKEWNWSPSQVLIATTGRHPTPEYDPRASTLARRWHRRHLPPASAPTERRVTRRPGPAIGLDARVRAQASPSVVAPARRVGGEAPVPAFEPVVSSPPPPSRSPPSRRSPGTTCTRAV